MKVKKRVHDAGPTVESYVGATDVSPKTDSLSGWDVAKTEYEQALGQYQNFTIVRRQDMAFVTTVQGAVLTIIGSKLPHLDLSSFVLSLIAFFILLLGVNSERRLAGYMDAYFKRARELESQFGMSLLSGGLHQVRGRRFLLSNSLVFPLFYLFFMLAWVVIWVRHLIS